MGALSNLAGGFADALTPLNILFALLGVLLGTAVGVLRERRFAWYFAARTVSTAGTAMAPVALAFAVLHLTDSAGALLPATAAARVTAGVTPRVRSLLRVRLLPFQVPASLWCTTRSPPTTSRPR